MVTRIGALFRARTDFNAGQIRLFDQVLGRLLIDVDVEARRELADWLAPLNNAPIGVIRLLAHDDAIEVAGRVLERSPRLADDDLVDIAACKGQEHLLAISGRASLTEPISELLVRRGGREVLRKLAGNCGARLSHKSFFALAERAADDAVLAGKVGSRSDLPPHLFGDLLRKATNKVATLQPHSKFLPAGVKRAGPADPAAPPYTREALHAVGKLDEASIVEFTSNGRYQNLVAALAHSCAVPIEVVERLMHSEPPDPVLVLCKSAGWGWVTAKAILMARPVGTPLSASQLQAAFADFERLPPSAAHRVRRFWQCTPAYDEAASPH
jgi:uncharacterized protein (DUF2336 family)